MSSRRRYDPKAKMREREDDEQRLLVFGYSSRLYSSSELVDGDPEKLFNRGLVSWQDDDTLKMDRYDGRLYLQNLDQFNAKESIGDGKITEMDSSEEQLEEVMCEEERYKDLYADMKKVEEEERAKQGKGAAIAFKYDDQPFIADPIVESSSEEEIEEVYLVPDGLKLPVGIDLPSTMKESAIIEKTAGFVVAQGPQMEIVIKAKQRNNEAQFGFLEFDHTLNPFYKYICKLIREKKYTPTPVEVKTRPKPKKVRRLAEEAERNLLKEIESESGGSDSDGDYLHPLLMGSRAPSNGNGSPSPTIGPTLRPLDKPTIPRQKTVEAPIKAIRVEPSEMTGIYSALFKNLQSLMPNSSCAEKEEKLETEIQSSIETDPAVIADYNEWHMQFYGRPSPYLPDAPPVQVPPAPNVISAISIAARYVAMNGGAAEQKLIEHNGESCAFLFAKSPYYTYYQAMVRQNYWMLNQSYMATLSQPCEVGFQPPAPPHFNAEPPKPPTSLTEYPTRMESQVDDEGMLEENDDEIRLKLERKEKARLFLERILKEKKASTKKGTMGNEISPLNEGSVPRHPSIDDGNQPGPSNTGEAKRRDKPMVLSTNAVSSLIDSHIRRALGGPEKKERTLRENADGDRHRSRKEHRHRRHRRKRSRSKSSSRSTSSSRSSESGDEGHRKRRRKEKTRSGR